MAVIPKVLDSDLTTIRRIKRIPYSAFVFDEIATDTLASLATGASVITEVSTFGIAGFAMTAGDMLIHTSLDLLQDIDLTAAIDVRVLWTTNAAPVATDGATFIVLYDNADEGEAIIEPATALDTVLVEHLEGGTAAYIFHRTAAGVINANTFDETAIRGMLTFRVELDAVTTFSADEVIFLGLELSYTPKLLATVNDPDDKHTAQGAL
jgi:hypothetical protein